MRGKGKGDRCVQHGSVGTHFQPGTNGEPELALAVMVGRLRTGAIVSISHTIVMGQIRDQMM